MKRAISLLLVAAMLLGMILGRVQAADSEEEALSNIQIYNGGQSLNCLAVNGSVQQFNYVYYEYLSEDGSIKEIPTYCVNPTDPGVPQKVPVGSSIEYIIQERESDPKIMGIVANGYPTKSLGELELNDKVEGYYATKIAFWCYIIPGWNISSAAVNPSAADQAQAERVLAAARQIYDYGTGWTEALNAGLTTSSDQSEATLTTIDGQQYKEQVFRVHSDDPDDPDEPDEPGGGSLQIVKLEEGTEIPLEGAIFDVEGPGGDTIGSFSTGPDGTITIPVEHNGSYVITEVTPPKHHLLSGKPPQTVSVANGQTATAQIQIIKKSADYNSTNGLPAGTLLEGAMFEIYDKANNLVDTIQSDQRGLAASRPLPLGRYTIREVKAPANYGVSDTVLNAYLEHEGQIVTFEVTNKSLSTGVNITKTGPKEIMSGQPVRYQFSGISNRSNVRLDSFYWRDTLPAQIRLDTVVTGTYNFPGNYKIVYRVNGGEPRTLADNLSTSQNYTLAASPVALGLASNERVTEVMFVFGQAPAGFAQVEAPAFYCTAVSGLKGGTSFVNVADVGGNYGGVWVQGVSRWVTSAYGKSYPLPKTGY